jgi:hypothetical protein
VYAPTNWAVGEKEDFIQLPYYELILLNFLLGGGQLMSASVSFLYEAGALVVPLLISEL